MPIEKSAGDTTRMFKIRWIGRRSELRGTRQGVSGLVAEGRTLKWER